MKNKQIAAWALCVFCICAILASIAYAISRKPRWNLGKIDLEFVQRERILRRDQKMLVWIDVNTTRREPFMFFPTPQLRNLAVNWRLVTYAPHFEDCGTLWCIAEIEVRDIEKLVTSPSVANVWLLQFGDSMLRPADPKLGPKGFQYVMDRALHDDEGIYVILFLRHDFTDYEFNNVTATLEQFGGRRLEFGHYEHIFAEIPARNIGQITRNPFIQSVWLHMPDAWE